MAVRGVLSILSEGLLSDDRILSSSDRELLKQILHHTQRPDPNNGLVAEALSRAVGEIVSQRAAGVLGEQVIAHLLRDPGFSRVLDTQNLHWGTPPQTPPNPGDLPPAPHPPSPGPPGVTKTTRATTVPPLTLADRFVLLDEFLAPAELKELTQFVLQRETEFRLSEVISPGVPRGQVDFEQRRSRVLMNSGPHGGILTDRLRADLPRLVDRLGVEPFSVSRIETQITASNQDDYFRWHTDSGEGDIASREVTFVYFFHREPKAFSGGELRIYESAPQGAADFTPNYETIVPEQNQMVVFRSSLAHEITRIECPTAAFADSRFTVNGWLHR